MIDCQIEVEMQVKSVIGSCNQPQQAVSIAAVLKRVCEFIMKGAKGTQFGRERTYNHNCSMELSLHVGEKTRRFLSSEQEVLWWQRSPRFSRSQLGPHYQPHPPATVTPPSKPGEASSSKLATTTRQG